MTIEEVPTVKIRRARKEIQNFQENLSELEKKRTEKIEKFNASRDRQYELACLRDEIVQKLAAAENSNKAAFFRHQGELEKVVVEMETAELLSKKLKEEIENVEYDLEVAKVNGHIFEGREDEVSEFEKEVENYEKDLANYRLAQETQIAENALRQLRRRFEEEAADKAEKERYQTEMNNRASLAFNNLKPIMQESLQKQRKSQKEQADAKKDRESKMRASVNELKDAVKRNTDNYHVIMRKKAVKDKRELRRDEEIVQEMMETHDISEVKARFILESEKRDLEWERKLEEQKKERQQKEEEIIMKLRQEDAFVKRSEKVQRTERLLKRSREDPNLLKKKNLTQQVRRVRQLENYRRPFSAESFSGSVMEGLGTSRDFSMEQHSKSFVDEEIHLSKDYAPLWDGVAPHDEENLNYKPTSAKQEVNLTTKIVADPPAIEFLDFELQKEYTINVTLTNAANEKTPIRLVRLSDNVMDLCSWDFKVLPSISPGISIPFQISFYPQMLESIDGYAEFKTLFGIFKLPIKMRPPKYDPKISHESVNFGNVIIGESIQTEIEIENMGAKGGPIYVDSSNLPDEFVISPKSENMKLGPKEIIKLKLKWNPQTVGHFNFPLFISTDENEQKKVEVSGHASLLPVSLSDDSLDFKVCSHGFLYQNQFSVLNSSNVSQPFSFNIPQNLKSAITISPQAGSVQAHTSSKIHIKFTPSAGCDFQHFLDEDTNVFEFPVEVSFQNFQKPLTTTLYAIINDPSLEIIEESLDFGNTTIFESTVHRVKITSRSLLVEEFGFSELPNFVSVRPGHGFASLAPGESMEIDILFSPMQASKYEFTIMLETLKGFKHRFKCKGVGVKPPLEISDQHLKLSTPLFSVNRATFTLTNTHTSRDEYSRPVARIGNGKIFPVTSTSFSFMPPEDCNLHFSPSVGVLKPGESVLVTVTHEPFIPEEMIYEKARTFPPPEIQAPPEPPQAAKKSVKGSRVTSKTPSRISSRRESRQSSHSNSGSRVSSASTLPPPPVEKNDTRYCQAKSILSENFGERRDRFSIACFISAEDVSKGRSWKNPSFDSGYCLFIDAELEITRPALVLENGMDVINMGARPVGTTEKQYFYLKNRSNSYLEITTTPLNPSGPFILANPVPKKLGPGDRARILIKFNPTNAQIYHDYLYLNYSKLDGINCPQRLELVGRGQKIDAYVEELQPQNEMPVVLLGGESYLETEIKNPSNFPVSFRITPSNDNSIDHNRNRNGKAVFDITPASGIISPQENLDLKIRFRPDHAGHFTEVFTLQFCETEDSTRVYRVNGYCSPNDVMIQQVDDFDIHFSDKERKQAGSGFTNPDKYREVIDHGPIMIQTRLNDLSRIQRPEYRTSFLIKILTPTPSRSSSKASKEKKKEKPSKTGPSTFEITLPDDFEAQVFPGLSGPLEGDATKFEILLKSKPSALPIQLTVNTSQTVKYQIFLQSD